MTNFFEAIINSFRAGWANNNHHQQYQEYYDYSIWGNSESSSHSAYMDWIFSSDENAHYANHNYNNNYPYDYAADSFWSNSYRRYDFYINTDYQNPTSNEDDYTYNPVIIGDAPLEEISKKPSVSDNTTNSGNNTDSSDTDNKGKQKPITITLPLFNDIQIPATAKITKNSKGEFESIEFTTDKKENIKIKYYYNKDGSLARIIYNKDNKITNFLYHKNGSVVASDEQNREILYENKEKNVKVITEYKDNNKIATFYQNGEIKNITTTDLKTNKSVKIIYDKGKPSIEEHYDEKGNKIQEFNIDEKGTKTLVEQKAPDLHSVYSGNESDAIKFIKAFKSQLGGIVISEAFHNPEKSEKELEILTSVGKMFNVTNPDKYEEIRKHIQNSTSLAEEEKEELLNFLVKLVDLRSKKEQIKITLPMFEDETGQLPAGSIIQKNNQDQITYAKYLDTYSRPPEIVEVQIEYNDNKKVSKMTLTIGDTKKERVFEYPTDEKPAASTLEKTYKNGKWESTTRKYNAACKMQYFDLPKMQLQCFAEEHFDENGILTSVTNGDETMTIKYKKGSTTEYSRITIYNRKKQETTRYNISLETGNTMSISDFEGRIIYFTNRINGGETFTKYTDTEEITTYKQNGKITGVETYNKSSGERKYTYYDDNQKPRRVEIKDSNDITIDSYAVDENGNRIPAKESK